MIISNCCINIMNLAYEKYNRKYTPVEKERNFTVSALGIR